MRFAARHYLTVLLFLVIAVSAHATTLPLVHASAGEFQGTRDASSAVRIFLGIPYAAPPVGPLRWRAPQPAPRSRGIVQATGFGPACMQNVINSRPPWTEEFMVHGRTSEDCLTLNIWAPRLPSKNAGVLVFFHGGAFTEGSGAVAIYDGAALAEQGIVVVTVNYRLGPFGFFASSALAAETPHHVAGNYGLLDQIAALHWVQRNIAAFGGDPSRVTIAGQSAGAQSVLILMASPLAKGLFRAAIADSGARLSPTSRTATLAQAEAAGDRWAAQHGGSLAALRAIPAEQLLASADLPPQASRPVVDNFLLPLAPTQELSDPRGSDVPVITGWNADEGSASPQYGRLSAQAFRAQAAQRYGPQASAFLALYPASDNAQAHTSQIAAARDETLTGAALWATTRSRHRTSPVYLYYFAHVPPWTEHPEYGAHHTAELPYFFANLSRVHREYTQADRQLSAQLSQLWVQFVNTGKLPPVWPPSSGSSGPFLVLQDPLSAANLPHDTARRRFWEQYLLSNP